MICPSVIQTSKKGVIVVGENGREYRRHKDDVKRYCQRRKEMGHHKGIDRGEEVRENNRDEEVYFMVEDGLRGNSEEVVGI